jgi:hypothetical protein
MVASIATNCTRHRSAVGHPVSGWIAAEVRDAVLSVGRVARAPGADASTPSLALPARGAAAEVGRRAMSVRQLECEEKRLLFKKGVSPHPAIAGTERERGALPCWST